MIKRLLVISVITALMPLLAAPRSQAGGRSCETSASMENAQQTCSTATARSEEQVTTSKGGKGEKKVVASVRSEPVCAFRRNGQCERGVACTTPGGTAGAYYAVYTDGGKIPGRVCLPPDDPRRPAPGITDALVARAVQRLNWTTPALTIQPPGGRTLVNLPTNVYADGRTQRLTVTLLTQQVTIEVTPTTYTWDFGDGTTLTTRTPGRPYPDLDVTHPYPRVGTFPIRLTTTLTGRYRTPTTPWADIPGVLRLTTAPQPLRVIEATPQLRGY